MSFNINIPCYYTNFIPSYVILDVSQQTQQDLKPIEMIRQAIE